MKTKHAMGFRGWGAICGLTLGLLSSVFCLLPLAAATNDLTSTLQRGLFEEEANHNLEAAERAYRAVSTQFDKDRKLAATAIYRLGEIYNKQGKAAEAAAQYERIGREFADQSTLVTWSRQKLSELGKAAAKAGTPLPTTAPTSGYLDGLQSQYALLKAQIDQSRGETNLFVVAKIFDDEKLSLAYSEFNSAQAEVSELKRIGAPEAQIRSAELVFTQVQASVKGLLKNLFDYQEKRLGILKGAIQQAGANQLPAATSDERSQDLTVTDAEEKEIRNIQALIKNSPDLINAPGEGGLTPLRRAAMAGQLTVARFLLDNGADVNGKSSTGDTALLLAAGQGHKAMVELLLARGADVEASNQGTALYRAAKAGYKTVAEALLAHKAAVNSTAGPQRSTPLFAAASTGRAPVVELLLRHGGSANATNQEGATPLMLATDKGYLEVVKLLLAAKADPNGGEKNLPLHLAIRGKRMEIATALLGAGADANRLAFIENLDQYGNRATTGGWFRPLELAIRTGEPQFVELMLKNHADPNGQDANNASVLPQAANLLATLKLLLEGGADANGKSADGTTALHRAAGFGNLETTRLLLEHKANPNVAATIDGEPGTTPLMRAATFKDPAVVELLLQAKADPNARGAKGNSALSQAIYNQRPATVRVLLKGGADPNTKNWNAVPALAYAAGDAANLDVLRELLAAKPDLNATDANGLTALHWAVTKRFKALAAALIEAGAEVNVLDKAGKTPLDIAKGLSTPGFGGSVVIPPPGVSTPTGPLVASQAELIALLRDHGAVDEMPDFNSIRVTRGTLTPVTVFSRDTEGLNRFTLLEVLANLYSLEIEMYGPNRRQGRGGVRYDRVANLVQMGQTLRFPDLAHIRIQRASPQKPAERREIVVNLVTGTNGIDCARNVPVEFGDLIEILEREHTLGEPRVGLTREESAALKTCIERTVRVTFRRDSVTVKVAGLDARLSEALNDPQVQNILRSSSDLTRIKVRRQDPKTKQTIELLVNSIERKDANELWLQDGDVVEVPEKTL